MMIEIDFVEEKEGHISAYEFKWNSIKTKFPKIFLDTYDTKGVVIDRTNFREFVII